eukprot:m.191323 g.191323  ORF g.191323 m.191323 type:complete len:325 (+) comp39447_c1_seq15:906-1880(+)
MGDRLVFQQSSDNTGHLFIEKAKIGHSGNYSCIASNKFSINGTESRKAQLKVQGDCAAFEDTTLRKTILLGANATIHCCSSQANSNAVAWTFENQTLISNDQRIVNGSQVTIPVHHASYNMSGTYTCKFQVKLPSGAETRLQKNVVVAIRGPPSPPLLLNASIETQTNGSRANLSCRVLFDGNSEIKNFKVKWSTDKIGPENARWNSRVHEVQGFSLKNPFNLTLDLDVSSSSDFWFSVSASNVYGISKESKVLHALKVAVAVAVSGVPTLQTAQVFKPTRNVSYFNATGESEYFFTTGTNRDLRPVIGKQALVLVLLLVWLLY